MCVCVGLLRFDYLGFERERVFNKKVKTTGKEEGGGGQ